MAGLPKPDWWPGQIFVRLLIKHKAREPHIMKHHLMIALGLLMAAVFSFRLANELLVPGIGGSELYLFGGVVIAALLIFFGLKERRHARAQARDQER